MNFYLNNYSIPLFIGALLSIPIVIVAARRRRIPGHRYFAAFMGMIGFWMLAYGLELSFNSIGPKLFWARMQYIPISSTAVFWLIFLLHYAEQKRWLKRWVLASLFIIPVITVAVVWLKTPLIWSKITLIDEEWPQTFFNVEYGSWFLVHTAFSYTVYLIDVIILMWLAFKSPRLDKKQSAIVIIGVLAVWAANALYIFGINPFPNLDLTPFALSVSGLAIAWSIFQVHLFDVAPIAHKAVVAGHPDGVFTLDGYNRIVAVNPAAEGLVNRKLNLLKGIPISDVIPADWAPLIYSTTIESNLSTEVEYNTPTEKRFYELRLAPVKDKQGQLQGRILLLRNISKRKNAQMDLVAERTTLVNRVESQTRGLRIANKELARAAQLKDEFLASMSHELRTPLNAIMGTAETLLDGIYGPVTQKQGEALERLEESSVHLLTLINDILDVAKIEAGEFQLVIEKASIQSVSESSLRLVRPDANRKSIKIVSAVQVSRPYVYADERRLKQILVNLLSNAVKFTKDGGKVGLGIFDNPEAQATHFVVWDTGIGIEQSNLDKLFQPFVQLDGGLNRHQGGSGLGLALTKRLVDMHGGQISVHSTPGKGSRFIVSIPWHLQGRIIEHERSSTLSESMKQSQRVSADSWV